MKGPTRETCDLVDERDSQCCVRCGRSLASVSGSRHHRQLRRHGDHGAANLILLCGSGTTGCHGLVHAKPKTAMHWGLIVSGYQDAAKVPLYRYDLHGWALQAHDGTLTPLTLSEAEKLRDELGMT